MTGFAVLTAVLFAGGVEPNNSPYVATPFPVVEFFFTQTQNQSFDSAGDVDWVVLGPPEGIYDLAITQLMPAPDGPLTLNLQIFDTDVLLPMGAAPVMEVNPCPAPPGASVLVSDLVVPVQTELILLRIADCNQSLAGGSYQISMDPQSFGSGAQAIRLTGTVTDANTNNVVPGLFLVSNNNASTFSGPGGAFSMIDLANTQVSLDLLSNEWELTGPVVVPPQVEGATVNAIDVQVQQIVLELSVADASASEAIAAASGLLFPVTLANGQPVTEFPVNYTLTSGSATANEDYIDTTGSLLFGGTNAAVQSISVSGLSDDDVELDETFSLTLAAPSPPDALNIVDGSAQGTLINDDFASLQIQPIASALEGDSISFDISLDRAVPTPFSVRVDSSDGSASAGSDYTPVSGALVQFAGSTGEVQTVTIETSEDTDVEANENFMLSLSSLSTSLVNITSGSATGTIVNDDMVVPMTADLSITKTDGLETLVPGQALTYTLVIENAGPNAAMGATVIDLAPVDLMSVSWTCAASAGASCQASGSGDIQTIVDLPVGGSLTFTLDGTVAITTRGSVVNTATVVAPPGVTDPMLDNNEASDVSATVLVFASSFEQLVGKSIHQWSSLPKLTISKGPLPAWRQQRWLYGRPQWRVLRPSQAGWHFDPWQSEQ